MIFDLHSHTNCSDGSLAPEDLIARALDRGIHALAITDHDTIEAYRDIHELPGNINLVSGIELSTQWLNTGIHILGLNIRLYSDAILAAETYQTTARTERARQISDNLRKLGIEDAFDGASGLSPGNYIGRPQFAQHLINVGRVDSMQAAFRKYLGQGKAGDVRQHWADMDQVIQWIRDAGGIAVLAHPLKYKLTRTKLKRLLDSFRQAGGQGMEVVSGQQNAQQTSDMGNLCAQQKLLGSCGSDFHSPGTPWAELGVFAPMPGTVTPVWDRF